MNLELTTSWLGRAWRALDECASTNDEAAAWARAGAPAGAVVTAETQTRGRGRLGRVWHSPPGASLYFSTVLRPALAPMKVVPLTLAAGVALAETVARFEVTPSLKWPNDLLLDGKKAAGILTESAVQGGRLEHVVVGIGVNLNVEEFPPALHGIATSLHRARGRAVDRGELAAVLCERLEVWHDRFVAGGCADVVAAWKSFARFFGRRVEVLHGNERVAGVADDLDEDGALRLRTERGILRVMAGEVVA
jgi:BirA family biotin operon repressor/biotin-[acetyl-CoA-carboxylase] ligase